MKLLLISKLSPKKRKLLVALLVVAITSLLFFHFFIRNYAAEVAQPVERSLVAQRAVQKCSIGDGGHSPDNNEPWYQSYYQVNVGEKEAIEIAKKAAQAAGYNLTQASLENKGHVGVADEYLSKWYFDSKKSPYGDLKDGDIEFAMTVNASGDGTVCKPALRVDETHSVISVDIDLPSYKNR